jgi:hypothetical protein
MADDPAGLRPLGQARVTTTRTTHVRRQATGHHGLNVADVRAFLALCDGAAVPDDERVHIEQYTGSGVPGDSAIWCYRAEPITE